MPDDEFTLMTVRISRSDLRAAKIAAARSDTSVSAYTREALADRVKADRAAAKKEGTEDDWS